MTLTATRKDRARRRQTFDNPGHTRRGGVTKQWPWIRSDDEPESDTVFRLGAYTREDRLFDELGQLPDQETIRMLVPLLRIKELRELAEGILNDCTQASRNRDILENAAAINSWVATAEEMVNSRRKFRFIQAARERSNPRNETTR